MPKQREITVTDHIGVRETGEVVDIIAISEKKDITVQDLRTVAEAVSGTQHGADYFMTHRHAVLGDRTPAEALEAGEGRVVLGMLLNAAGV